MAKKEDAGKTGKFLMISIKKYDAEIQGGEKEKGKEFTRKRH